MFHIGQYKEQEGQKQRVLKIKRLNEERKHLKTIGYTPRVCTLSIVLVDETALNDLLQCTHFIYGPLKYL